MAEGLENHPGRRHEQDVVDFYNDQEELRNPSAEASDNPPETPPDHLEPTADHETPPETPETTPVGKLTFAALDEGIVFYNPDKTRHTFSSPEEETEAQMAAARLMATGQQTPGMPELELAMLDEHGKEPVLDALATAPANAPENHPTFDPNKFQVLTQSDGAGGFQNTHYRYIQPDGTMLRNPDGTERTFTQEEVSAIRNPAGGAAAETAAERRRRELLERLDRRHERARAAAAGAEAPPRGPRRADVVEAGETGGPELPRWAGRYGASWRDFDASEYAGHRIRTMPEIRASARDQQLFGEMIVALDPSKTEAFEKFKRNEPLSPDERRFFGFVQHELSKQIERSEWVEQNLDPKEIELMMAKDEDFRFMVQQNGVERTTQAFKQAIFHKAVQDKAAFESFYYALKDLKDNQKTNRAKKAEKETDELCKRYGIKRANYADFFDPKHPRESEQRLKNHISERAGKFRKYLDKVESKWGHLGVRIAGSSRSAALHATIRENLRNPDQYRFFDPRSWVTGGHYTSILSGENRGIAGSREDMLDFLAASISGPEFRHAMEREAHLGEKVVPATESGPQTFDEMKSTLASERNKPEAMERLVRNYVESVPNWDRKPVEEQNSLLRNVKATQEVAQSKGMGFIAWLTRIIFGKNFDDAASKVVGRPVHV